MPKAEEGTGRISTFQAPSEGQSDLAQQSPKDRETMLMVEKLFARYKQHRHNYDQTWVENYRFFRGNQWKEPRPAYRNVDVLNFTNASIQTIIPILTDNRPNVVTIPENPSDFDFSEIMTQVLTAKWDRDNYSQIVVEALVDAMIYGTAITSQEWNADLLNGLGDYEWKTIDPMYCYPDARSGNINDGKGEGFITAIPTDLAQVKREHPDQAHMLKADLADIDVNKAAKIDQNDFTIRSATDNLTLVQNERPHEKETAPQILVVTAWLDDNAMIEEKVMEKDADGKERQKGFRLKKKYPNGRKVKIANKVLLEDIDNPYIDGKMPFAKLVDYTLPREFWGEGEVEQLKGPNRILNKLWGNVMDTLDLMGNPVWKNPVGSGVFDESIVNKPGLVIPYNEGSEPSREMGLDVQASVFQAFDRMQQVFDKLSGVNDVSRGVVPAGTSGVAIDQLQEADQTRIRLKARNVDAWLNDVGQQFASRILQFYSVPRIVRITEDENTERYFKIAIDEITNSEGDPQRFATIQPIDQVQQEDGTTQMVEGAPVQHEIKGNLDIRITVGTTLPFRKAQKKQQAKELFQLGIYDAEDLLEDLEHPRKESILNKYNQRQEAAAQAEAQAAEQELQFRMAELQAKTGAAPQPAPPSQDALAAVPQ